MNRRDILKKFGIGSVIVPIIGGGPQIADAVTLVEVPKVVPLTLRLSKPIDLSEAGETTIAMKMWDGTIIKINGWVYAAEGRLDPGQQIQIQASLDEITTSSPCATIRRGKMTFFGAVE